MLDKIVACKPKSIFEIIPEEMFRPDFSTNYLYSGNCFEWNYAIAKAIQPETYLEIGVRFGYSFIPTLHASKNLGYAEGWDLETYGSNDDTWTNIKKYGPQYSYGDGWGNVCRVQLKHIDSQQISEIPQFYDLINIDGCHDYDCKMHDLRLTIGKCKYVAIDDYDYLPEVHRACNDFLAEVRSDGWGKPSPIEWFGYIPSFRGTLIIKYKNVV